MVTQVQPRSPAAKAGVKVGDLILDFAGKAVTGPAQLQRMVEMCKADSTEPLAILRNGKPLTIDVVCAERPTNFSVARASHRGPGMAEPSRFQKLGIQAEDLTPEVAQQLGIEAQQGVVITNVRSGSPADLAGLTTGMVISEVDRQPVKTVQDFRRMLANRPLTKGILLLVRTDEGSRFVVIQVQSD